MLLIENFQQIEILKVKNREITVKLFISVVVGLQK